MEMGRMGWVHIGVRVWEAEQRSKGMLDPLMSHQRPKLQGCQRSRGDLHQSQTEARSQMKANHRRILKPGSELSHTEYEKKYPLKPDLKVTPAGMTLGL